MYSLFIGFLNGRIKNGMEMICTAFSGIQSMADVMSHGRLRWFGYLKRESEEDWVSARRIRVAVGQNVGAGRH